MLIINEKTNRREFLAESKDVGIGIATGALLVTSSQSTRAASANDKIVLGVVGIRGRGYCVGMGFAERPDCEVAYLADIS